MHSDSLTSLDFMALAERLGHACQAQGVTVTTAESCTGGGVASAITAVSGSSAYFETGYVTYSNAAKRRLLGVPTMMLEAHGAVSRETVEAMVAGACRECGADIGVAVSGVAGPGGGSPDKPVGTVWLAWGNRKEQRAWCCRFDGDRTEIREKAVRVALEGLIREIEDRTHAF